MIGFAGGYKSQKIAQATFWWVGWIVSCDSAGAYLGKSSLPHCPMSEMNWSSKERVTPSCWSKLMRHCSAGCILESRESMHLPSMISEKSPMPRWVWRGLRSVRWTVAWSYILPNIFRALSSSACEGLLMTAFSMTSAWSLR